MYQSDHYSQMEWRSFHHFLQWEATVNHCESWKKLMHIVRCTVKREFNLTKLWSPQCISVATWMRWSKNVHTSATHALIPLVSQISNPFPDVDGYSIFPSSCNIRLQEWELCHPIKLQKDLYSVLWLVHTVDAVATGSCKNLEKCCISDMKISPCDVTSCNVLWR